MSSLNLWPFGIAALDLLLEEDVSLAGLMKLDLLLEDMSLLGCM